MNLMLAEALITPLVFVLAALVVAGLFYTAAFLREHWDDWDWLGIAFSVAFLGGFLILQIFS